MENLTPEDLDIIIQSLDYSRKNISDSQDSPYDLKQLELAKIANVKEKISAMKKALTK